MIPSCALLRSLHVAGLCSALMVGAASCSMEAKVVIASGSDEVTDEVVRTVSNPGPTDGGR